MDTIFTRISVRHFEPKPVEEEKIDKVLRAAFAAPSAKNQQPWEFFVVTNRDVLQELGNATPYAGPVRNATAAIVVAYRKEGLNVPEFAQIDCAIATENILLELEAQGLGGVMIGTAPHKAQMAKVAKAVNMPENLEAFTIVAFGYPAKRRPQEDRYDAKRIHYVK